MGLLLSIGKDTRQIIDDTKDLLTLVFKILISLVTVVQDIEDVILEIKDLSDMLHFSINSVDKCKVDKKLGHLKNVAEELGNRAKDKHKSLKFLSMILEDMLKLRYGTDWKERIRTQCNEENENDNDEAAEEQNRVLNDGQ